jgi:hypothetical protein
MGRWKPGWMNGFMGVLMGGWMKGWMGLLVDGWIGGWVGGWMGRWMCGWVNGWTHGQTNGWMYGRTDGWVRRWMVGWFDGYGWRVSVHINGFRHRNSSAVGGRKNDIRIWGSHSAGIHSYWLIAQCIIRRSVSSTVSQRTLGTALPQNVTMYINT